MLYGVSVVSTQRNTRNVRSERKKVRNTRRMETPLDAAAAAATCV